MSKLLTDREKKKKEERNVSVQNMVWWKCQRSTTRLYLYRWSEP